MKVFLLLASHRARREQGDKKRGLWLPPNESMKAVIGGSLAVESKSGHFTLVTIELPEASWQSWEAAGE
jgi:hypothetical protein